MQMEELRQKMEQVRRMRDDADQLEHNTFRKCGYDYTCRDTPNGIWLWEGYTKEGSRVMVDTNTLRLILKVQIDHYLADKHTPEVGK